MRLAHLPTSSAVVLLTALAGGALQAADGEDLSIVPQLNIGTAGFEPGVAVEYRPAGERSLIVRPEVFLSEDNHAGFGGSLLWDVTRDTGIIPASQSFAIGPRFVYHNADDTGWELDAIGIYGFDLDIGRAWRHSLEIVGTIGLAQDRDHDNTELGASIGGAYAFRF